MRIDVLASEGISPQARTYAEYRVFAAVSQLMGTDGVSNATVVLGDAQERRDGPGVSCSVEVAIGAGDAIRVRATGPHAFAAINRAVDLLRTTALPPRRANDRLAMASKVG